MKYLCFLLSFCCLLTSASLADTASAGTPTPPMGWNSWNWHGKQDINEKVVRETIDAMVSTGLRDAGYNYVVIDGGWRGSELGPDAHARGMKLGVHTVPGSHDCGGDAVGGFGREEVHVQQLADWGIDLVKLDRCVLKTEGGWNEELIESVYRKWADLIAASDHEMLLSISAYEFRDWYPEVCAMARTTLDISARVKGDAVFEREVPQRNHISVMQIADLNNQHAAAAGDGYWNDPDMLVTGEQGMTEAEQEAHFALWCVMTSPLMLGNDPRNMTEFERDLLTNQVAIEVNQDPTEQGRRISKSGGAEIWVKRLTGGQVAVLLLNRGTEQLEAFHFDAGAIAAVASSYTVRDIFGKQTETSAGILEAEIGPRSAKFYLVTPR